jgi:hypothetical protein
MAAPHVGALLRDKSISTYCSINDQITAKTQTERHPLWDVAGFSAR